MPTNPTYFITTGDSATCISRAGRRRIRDPTQSRNTATDIRKTGTAAPDFGYMFKAIVQ